MRMQVGLKICRQRVQLLLVQAFSGGSPQNVAQCLQKQQKYDTWKPKARKIHNVCYVLFVCDTAKILPVQKTREIHIMQPAHEQSSAGCISPLAHLSPRSMSAATNVIKSPALKGKLRSGSRKTHSGVHTGRILLKI